MTPENPEKPITLDDIMAKVATGELSMEEIDKFLAAQEAVSKGTSAVEPIPPVVAPSAEASPDPVAADSEPTAEPVNTLEASQPDSMKLGDLYVYLNSLAVEQETARIAVEERLQTKFDLSYDAAEALMYYLEHTAKIIDAKGNIYQNVLDAAVSELRQDATKVNEVWKWDGVKQIDVSASAAPASPYVIHSFTNHTPPTTAPSVSPDAADATAMPSPASTPTDVELGSNPETLDEILDNPYRAERKVRNWLELSGLETQAPKSLDQGVERTMERRLESLKSREELLEETSRNMKWYRNEIANAVAYKKIFSSQPYEGDPRVSDLLNQVIKEFLATFDGVQAVLEKDAQVEEACFKKLSELPDSHFQPLTAFRAPISPAPTTLPPDITPAPTATTLGPQTLDEIPNDSDTEFTVKSWVWSAERIEWGLPPFEERVATTMKWYLRPEQSLVDTLRNLSANLTHTKGEAARALAYKNIFSSQPFETDSRFSDAFRKTINAFLTKFPDLQTAFEERIQELEACYKKINEMTNSEYQAALAANAVNQAADPGAPDPDPIAAGPLPPDAAAGEREADAADPAAMGRVQKAAMILRGWTEKIPKKKAIALLSGGAIALAGYGLIGGDPVKNGDQKRSTPDNIKKIPGKGAPQVAAEIGTSKPAPAMKQEVTPSASALNPNFEKSAWWTHLSPETKKSIEDILKSDSAETYSTPFLEEIEILHEAGTIRPSKKTISDLYKNIDQFDNMLNVAASGTPTEISQCVITLQDETTKETKTCYLRKNLTILAKSYQNIRGVALGENMYEPFPSGKLTETYAWMKAKLIAKANAEAPK